MPHLAGFVKNCGALLLCRSVFQLGQQFDYNSPSRF